MMESIKICRLVLCLAILLQGVWSRRPFKSLQSPKETIKNYEVFTPAIKYGDQQASSLNLSIVTKTYNFTIRLAMNRQLLAPGFTSKHFDSRGKGVITKGHPNCFYHGEVDGYPSWSVAISTCRGIRGSFGDMATKTSLFHIEPLGNNKNRSFDEPHVLFMEAEYENRTRTCGTSHDHNVKPESIRKELHHLVEKFKRQATGQSITPLIVELVIINDLAQYQKYSSDLQMTVNRAIDITNGADNLYKTFGIRVVLVQVITWTSGNLISIVPDSGTTLTNLQVYAPSVTIQHDVTMLLTGISLNSFVVGLAYVGGMCSSYSVNLVEDFGSLPAVSSTTAHEIGHLFSMEHDNVNCSCAQPTGCIMSAVQGSVVPNRWSSCSVNYITTALSTTTLGSCLTNVPTTIVGPPKCGNGILEGNETCDCGSLQECTNPCCNATTCQLAAGAQCNGGSCCSNCRFLSYGTTCRASNGECDVAEVCTGCSSQCPVDQYVQDGTSCGSGSGYCYNGSCPTRDSQCKAFYGSAGGGGDSSCYNYNVRGDLHGNCGPTGSSTYAACITSNVFCGSLQCANTGNQFPTISIFGSLQLGTHGTATATCKSFIVTPSDGSITNIWLVQNGTKCGTNQICLSSQCLPLTSLNTRACPVGSNGLVCSGNGVCTNGGSCSCKVGFTDSACGTVYISAVCAAPSSSIITPASSKSSSIPVATPVSTSLPISTRPNSTPGPISPSASVPATTPSRPASTSLPISTRPNSTPRPISLSASIPATTPSRPVSTSLPISTRPNSTPGPISPSASVPATTPSRPASTSLPISTRPNSTPRPISPSASVPAATPSRPASTSLPIYTRPNSTPGPISLSASIPATTSTKSPSPTAGLQG